MAPTTSPLQLRAAAIKFGNTQFAGPLTVTPEGRFVIAGRFCTLNEAIIACGTYDLRRAA
jgi:hypothetical protein